MEVNLLAQLSDKGKESRQEIGVLCEDVAEKICFLLTSSTLNVSQVVLDSFFSMNVHQTPTRFFGNIYQKIVM